MTIRDLMRRLDAAEATIRPHNSLAARLKRLTPYQRATYDQWRAARDKWTAQFDKPDALYEAVLCGNDGPQLPASIKRALSSDTPQILESDTESEAAEKYQRVLQR